MHEKENKKESNKLAIGIIAIPIAFVILVAYILFDLINDRLGGTAVPKPISQEKQAASTQELENAATIKIDRQKNLIVVRVPIPAKESPAPEESARAAWGQLGDYFGGVLNPIIGFVSLLILLATLYSQRKELKQSTRAQNKSVEALDNQNKAIKKQSFEQTFFAWLGTYHDALRDISFDSDQTKAYGRDALKKMWEENIEKYSIGAGKRFQCFNNYFGTNILTKESAIKQSVIENKPFDQKLFNAQIESLQRIADLAKKEWEILYKSNENKLGSLFRVLYRLIHWVDNQTDFTEEEKHFYVGIIRSHLSLIEMIFLFYNGLTPRGAKFKPLIERYALFDNLTFDTDRVLEIFMDVPLELAVYEPSAYCSKTARLLTGIPPTSSPAQHPSQ